MYEGYKCHRYLVCYCTTDLVQSINRLTTDYTHLTPRKGTKKWLANFYTKTLYFQAISDFKMLVF